jgi:lipopolysaccharide/colanic/teichoic acid biosynthesis glycosyltransferase
VLELARDKDALQSASKSETEDEVKGSVCTPIAPSPSDLRTFALSGLRHQRMPWWKRMFDIVVAGLLLAILSPLLFFIGLFIRCVSPGPVLFSQKRLGEMGEYFVIYKFRTLQVVNSVCATQEHRTFVSNIANSDAVAAKPDLRARMIPWGGFLRSTSLDELPQLINVLKGEMSLIGPRPDVLDWQDYPTWQLRRFEVTPGITGLWQVSGKNSLTFKQMVELDIRYIERRSILLDLWILVKTVRLVLKKGNK